MSLIQDFVLVLLHEAPEFVTGQSFSGVGFDEIQDDAFEDCGISLAGGPSLAELLKGLSIEGLVSVVVNSGEVTKDAGADDGGPNGEDLGLDIVIVLQFSTLQLGHILWGQQTVEVGVIKVQSLAETGMLIRPRELIGYLQLTILVDEDIFRLDIS